MKIFLSGGVTREDVTRFRDIIDAFGIGGAIANAPVIDFGMDIVEIDGMRCAKRGKRSGVKQVYEIPGRGHVTAPEEVLPPNGGVPLITRMIEHGKVMQPCNMQRARERFLASIETSHSVERSL